MAKVKIFRCCSTISFTQDYFRQQYHLSESAWDRINTLGVGIPSQVSKRLKDLSQARGFFLGLSQGASQWSKCDSDLRELIVMRNYYLSQRYKIAYLYKLMKDAIAVYDQRMHSIIDPDAKLEKLADGAQHTEGPVYFPEDDSVIFSDVRGNKLLRWSATDGVSVIREPSYYQNGNYRDLSGRLVACSHGQRAIIRREDNGEWIVLCDRYQNNRLNSPNDLVVKSDGTIWFTDPPFGLTQPGEGYGGNQEQAGSFVFRFDPNTGELDAVIKEMERPNGLAFSPDESILYVSDTSQVDHPQSHHYIRAYDLRGKKEVANSRVFAVIEPGQPDGLRVDKQGNIFTSSADSVQVYAPDGTRWGKIFVPEVVANLTFGGKDGKCLFITAGNSLYAINLKK